MFITLEGVEGSGKTTQIEAIAQFLQDNGHQVVTTREPGATLLGKKIRSILLDPQNRDISPICELMLYGADRAQHITEVILPALKSGKTVLCDRFFDATVAYQGFGRGIDLQLIESIYKIVAGNLRSDIPILKPDLTILFDIDPLIGLKRTLEALQNGQRDRSETRFEEEHLDFHKRVREGYLKIANIEKWRFFVIDASMSKQEILKKILEKITAEIIMRQKK
ncbi:MAG: dTMP kinase [Desulfamplus sp.]|nr:dTMP kinase [Desulfamplus sp.]MBF0241410.1 dTMP kinase [Desulfamplus sp.]